jgi:ABC-type antimicrobial peptide transport system permease subunit
VGASKRDISRVFNAETFIVGLAAGLVGIGVTELLLIPTNFLIHNVAKLDASAVLDPVAAVILVGISVFLTFIAGLIPSRNAARKDPVIALRTE